MAIITAVKSGNWSDPTVWDSNPVLPGDGNTVKPGAFVITIDQNVDLGAGALDCRNQIGYFKVTTGGLTAICSDVYGGAHAESGLHTAHPQVTVLTVHPVTRAIAMTTLHARLAGPTESVSTTITARETIASILD